MAFEMKCLRKFIRISYSEHKTNVWVQSEMNSLMGPQELLQTTVKRRKLAWFRHVTRQDSFYITILQVVLEEGDAVVGRGGNAGRTHWRVGIPANTRAAHMGLLQKGLEEDLCWIVLRVPSETKSVKGLKLLMPLSLKTDIHGPVISAVHYDWPTKLVHHLFSFAVKMPPHFPVRIKQQCFLFVQRHGANIGHQNTERFVKCLFVQVKKTTTVKCISLIQFI